MKRFRKLMAVSSALALAAFALAKDDWPMATGVHGKAYYKRSPDDGWRPVTKETEFCGGATCTPVKPSLARPAHSLPTDFQFHSQRLAVTPGSSTRVGRFSGAPFAAGTVNVRTPASVVAASSETRRSNLLLGNLLWSNLLWGNLLWASPRRDACPVLGRSTGPPLG